jgi:hypothetical protein
MRKLIPSFPAILTAFCIIGCGASEQPAYTESAKQNSPPETLPNLPSELLRVWVEETAAGEYLLMVNDEPFRIRGAGVRGNLPLLAQMGANSIRTWGINDETQTLLDDAHDLGLKVTLGLWLRHERHGFDYRNPEQIQQQREIIKDAVLRFRDHPALLLWGLGNEMEAFQGYGDREDIWREVNELARMVKTLDPNHPVMPVVANINHHKVSAIQEFAPDVDILGINIYSGAGAVGDRLRQYGWNKPYVVTEFGAPGPWEVEKTIWGSPIEPSSRQMAAIYYATYTQIMEDEAMCLGCYTFLWGHKQETTPTWFGMFLPSGETTPRLDAMARAWSGKWPINRAPILREANIPVFKQTTLPGEVFNLSVSYEDPEGETLTYQWQLFHESTDRKTGGDKEPPPSELLDAIVARPKPGDSILTTPETPGAYRVFVTVRDGQGAGSTDNWPFSVQVNLP